MSLSIIVAMDRNGLIGRDGDLPWRLSSDLKHFKQITMGKPIVMGRKTHESIGRPLPGRDNIIITRNHAYAAEGCVVLHSMQQVSAIYAGREVMLIGGAELYAQTLDMANRLYLTEVHAELAGDTYFPRWSRKDWHEIDRQDFNADEKNEHDYSFVVLERRAG